MPLHETEMCLRLIVAAVLSGLIGYERERRGRTAGLRTHVLVGVGSALVMLTGMYIHEIYNGHGMFSSDPARLGAQVVSGIGFLGAGTIMRSHASVRGLTTAAGLWTVAGVGLAVGSGFYLGAVVVTGIALVALFLLTRLEPRYRGRHAKGSSKVGHTSDQLGGS